nr:Peptidase M8 domain containing protein [Haemonchus contortus]
MIVTRKVREEARRHFNCSTLEGAELENQEISGTLGSHWEKRAFESELMTADSTQPPVLSRLSLALFEDSGWYKVNYECAAKRLEKLQCNLVTANKIPSEEIPPEYDYNINNLYHDKKGQPVVGFGAVDIADFCPYYMSTVLFANVTPICTRPVTTKLEEDPFQTHSLTSRCMDMNINVKVYSEVSRFMWMHSVGCFESVCKNNLLMIRTQQSDFYPCYRKGQIIHVEEVSSSYGGGTTEFQIVCPSCLELCDPRFCSEKFEEDSIRDDPRFVIMSLKNLRFGVQVIPVSLLMLFLGIW